MSPTHQPILARLLTACTSDTRIIAAIVYGSNASDVADEYSDLDVGVITTTEAYEEFIATRADFVSLLGEPLFLESFARPNLTFIFFSDGTEMELAIWRASQLNLEPGAPYQVLLDKQNIFANPPSESEPPDSSAQEKNLRDLIIWFWHDLSHFITAMGRGHLWWAYGQLDILRLVCVNLARLTHDFSDPEVGEDGYFKVDKVLTSAQLSPLQATFCPQEKDAMLRSAHIILNFYRDHAIPLAQAHGIAYPARLDHLMSERLQKLSIPL